MPSAKRAAVAALTVCLGGALILAFGVNGMRAEGQSEPKPMPRPVMSVHEVMEAFAAPLYQDLRQQLQEAPAGSDQWLQLEQSGLKAAELANLIALREVNSQHPRQWLISSSRLQDAAMNLSLAAKTREVDVTRDAYRELIARCNDCHRVSGSAEAPQLEL